MRTYKYRIYPTKIQAAELEKQLGEACFLYNAALEQRRTCWKDYGKSVSYNEQSADIKHMRREGLLDGSNNFTSQQQVLRRLDKAFAAFFRRVKEGEKAGFPRFRSRMRYNSLTWMDGWKIKDGRLRVQNIGSIRVRWHRELLDHGTSLQIKCSCGKWYAYFVVEDESQPLPKTGKGIGIDLGINAFVATSDGKLIKGPNALKKAQAELREAARRVARRKKGSGQRRKAVALLAKKHERVKNIRADHAHKLSRSFVNSYDLIAVENLNVRGMVKNHSLAKSISDQGWAQFVFFLSYKAESAGRTVAPVDAKHTSQICSGCGQIVPKKLSDRVHECDCGTVLDRDVNAAKNILARARNLPLDANVERRVSCVV